MHEVVTPNTEMCPLSVSTGVCVKRVNLRENIRVFVGTNRSVHIKRVSVERDFPVKDTITFHENNL